MKTGYLLIGTMLALALMLCISPVGALSGSDFSTIFDKRWSIPEV